MPEVPGYLIPTGRAELERRILGRAREDPEFRERLTREPRAAVGELLDVVVPDGLEIGVVQETPGELFIVLPVDLSGMGHDAVWAMLGRVPDPDPPSAAK